MQMDGPGRSRACYVSVCYPELRKRTRWAADLNIIATQQLTRQKPGAPYVCGDDGPYACGTVWRRTTIDGDDDMCAQCAGATYSLDWVRDFGVGEARSWTEE